jgi:hypothetical protein
LAGEESAVSRPPGRSRFLAALGTTKGDVNGESSKIAFAKNLVKPPGALNSRQLPDSMEKINPKTIAYLPLRIC